MSNIWIPYEEYLAWKRWEEDHPPIPPAWLAKIWQDITYEEENKIANDEQANSISNKKSE